MQNEASFGIRLTVVVVLLAFAAFAGLLAWSEWPREQARDTLNALSDGRDVSRISIEGAQEQMALAVDRLPLNGAHKVAQGRLALSLVRLSDPDEAREQAAIARDFFRDGLRQKPNARGAWRGIFAAEYVARGPSSELERIFEGVYLFDSGTPLSALTMLDIALRHPEVLTAERLHQVLGLAQPLLDKWYLRRPMARLYKSLPEDQRQTLLQSLDDGEAFAKWADGLDR